MLTQAQTILQSDFQSFQDLPESFLYSRRLVPKILEAQDIDLQEILGYEFYVQVAAVLNDGGSVNNPSTTGITAGTEINFGQVAYDRLLNYLKPIVVCYSISRYYSDENITPTRWGARQKENNWSKEVDQDQKDRVAQHWKSKAFHYSENLEKMLNANSADYPDWNDEEMNSSSSFLSIGVGGA